MPRTAAHGPLSVYLNRRRVGLLTQRPSGAIEYQYHESWLNWRHAFPISLSLPLRESRYSGAPVIAVIDNLLPDDLGIRRRIAERVAAAGTDPYSLLSVIGRDCVGALQFLPAGEEPQAAGPLEAGRVNDRRIAALLAELRSAPLGMSGEDSDFRISIAGVQEKTALLFWKGKWCIPHRSTPTTHIFKPQIGLLRSGIDLRQSVENEHFCMTLMRSLDFPTATTRIADFEGHRVLIVERFDREWTSDGRLLRLPQEDCCQALSVPSVAKYQTEGGPGIQRILELLKASDTPDEDRSRFLRAQVVFWLLGATDGHAKNFSIFLHPGGFRMTPLYDVMSTQPLVDAHQLTRKRMRLAMSVGTRNHYAVDTIMPRHFLQSAQRAGYPSSRLRQHLDELRDRLPTALDTLTASLPSDFPEPLASSIIKGVTRRASVLLEP